MSYAKKKEYLPIREASELTGIGPQTLRVYADKGKIEAYRTPTGQRMFSKQSLLGITGHLPTTETKRKIVYCRVSSKKQLDDLERQCQFLRTRYPDHELVTDCGSGINFKRKGLQTLLEQTMLGQLEEIVVAHKDRLCRFGFELIEFVCNHNNTKLIVLDHEEHRSTQQELADDIMAIVTVFACKQMGQRKYKTGKMQDQTDQIVSHI